MQLETLYGHSSTGTMKEWEVSVVLNEDGTADLVKKFGQVDGKMQVNTKNIKKGKNIGRSNETTPFEQAQSEAQSAWQKKVDAGYHWDLDQLSDPGKKEIKLPMLALGYEKRKHDIIFPCFVQPKLNGVRCLVEKIDDTTIQYTSRKGKPYTTVEHLTPFLLSAMEVGDILDGEIYVHDWSFQRIVRAVKKQREDSLKLQFHTYDLCDENLSFEDRWEKLVGIASFMDNIKVVHVATAQNEDEIKTIHSGYVQLGYEGTIVRNKTGKYKFKHRSKDLQKYKDFIDAEFKIIGGKEGTGNDEGCVIFEVETGEGKPFFVRPKGSVEQRRKWFNNLLTLIGKKLTTRYQELSEGKIPIFPVGIAIRDYE